MSRYLWPVLAFVLASLLVCWHMRCDTVEAQADIAAMDSGLRTIKSLKADRKRLEEENAALKAEVESLRPWSITVSEADYDTITQFLRSEIEQRNQE